MGGPGTFVVTVFMLRCGTRSSTATARRVAREQSRAATTPTNAVSASPASGSCDCLEPAISLAAPRRAVRANRPPHTGRSKKIAETWLSVAVLATRCAPTPARACAAPRRPGSSPRAIDQVAEARRDHGEHDVVDRAAEPWRIVPDVVQRRARAHVHRRCGPIDPSSDVGRRGPQRRPCGAEPGGQVAAPARRARRGRRHRPQRPRSCSTGVVASRPPRHHELDGRGLARRGCQSSAGPASARASDRGPA